MSLDIELVSLNMTDCVDGAGGPGLASLRGQAGLRMEEVTEKLDRTLLNNTGWQPTSYSHTYMMLNK